MRTRIYLALLIICAGLGQLSAQRFRVGLSAGLTASDIDGAHTRAKQRFHKVGFAGGVLGNAQIAKQVVFQFEINYIQKGSLQPPDSLNMGYYNISLHYVEIPLLLKRQIYINYKGKKVNKIDIEGGVSYARLLRVNVIGGTNYPLSGAANYFNQNVVSLLAGVDYNFTKNVYFCFRYSNSITPAVKRNAPMPGFLTYTFNRGNSLVLQFGFKFVFGGGGTSTPQAVDPAAPAQQ